MSYVLLFAAYLSFCTALSCRSYKTILIFNIASCALAGLYLLLNDAYAGAVISALAGLASFTQLCLPMRDSQLIKRIRNSAAVIFAIAAIMVLYNKPSDILPCLAFCNNRLFEAQANGQLFRLGMFISGLLWGLYGFYSGLYLFAFAEMFICLYAVFAFARLKERPAEQMA